MKLSLWCFLIIAVSPCACKGTHQQQTGWKGGGEMKLSLVSPAFEEGGEIPRKHTCDGADVSPALAWGSAPPGVRSFALICDDPDAPMGVWVHWVIFNLSDDARALPEGVATREKLEHGAMQGVNGFGNIGYGGPCPPHGAHRYFFRLYALDVKPDLSGRVTKDQLLRDMEGHILGEAHLMGRYKRNAHG